MKVAQKLSVSILDSRDISVSNPHEHRNLLSHFCAFLWCVYTRKIFLLCGLFCGSTSVSDWANMC
jgi:hypothetical protein